MNVTLENPEIKIDTIYFNTKTPREEVLNLLEDWGVVLVPDLDRGWTNGFLSTSGDDMAVSLYTHPYQENGFDLIPVGKKTRKELRRFIYGRF